MNEKERLSGLHVSLFVSIHVPVINVVGVKLNNYLFEMLLLSWSLAVVCYKQTVLTLSTSHKEWTRVTLFALIVSPQRSRADDNKYKARLFIVECVPIRVTTVKF